MLVLQVRFNQSNNDRISFSTIQHHSHNVALALLPSCPFAFFTPTPQAIQTVEPYMPPAPTCSTSNRRQKTK